MTSTGYPGPGTMEHVGPDPIEPVGPDQIDKDILEALTDLACWEAYFNGMITIGIFGGQLTFVLVLSDVYDPRKTFTRESSPSLNFDKETVRLFVALAFLFFTIALGAAAVGRFVLTNPTTKRKILRYFRNGEYWPLRWFTIAGCCIDYFPMLSFLFLGLAVGAYVPGVGWTVAACFIITLVCKSFGGHLIIDAPEGLRSWRLVVASLLWQEHA